MRPKQIIGLLVVVSIVGGAIWFGQMQQAKQEAEPPLASLAEPFTNDPLIMSDGREVPAWQVSPSSAQRAKLIEDAVPVVIQKLFTSEWSAVGEGDARRATLTAEFTRRDEGGRWEFEGTYQWANPGWTVVDGNLES